MCLLWSRCCYRRQPDPAGSSPVCSGISLHASSQHRLAAAPRAWLPLTGTGNTGRHRRPAWPQWAFAVCDPCLRITDPARQPHFKIKNYFPITKSVNSLLAGCPSRATKSLTGHADSQSKWNFFLSPRTDILLGEQKQLRLAGEKYFSLFQSKLSSLC